MFIYLMTVLHTKLTSGLPHKQFEQLVALYACHPVIGYLVI